MTVSNVRVIQYAMLPVVEGWILRCVANGRIVERSREGESTIDFERRVRVYCMDKATESRQVELTIHNAEGYAERKLNYTGTTEAP